MFCFPGNDIFGLVGFFDDLLLVDERYPDEVDNDDSALAADDIVSDFNSIFIVVDTDAAVFVSIDVRDCVTFCNTGITIDETVGDTIDCVNTGVIGVSNVSAVVNVVDIDGDVDDIFDSVWVVKGVNVVVGVGLGVVVVVVEGVVVEDVVEVVVMGDVSAVVFVLGVVLFVVVVVIEDVVRFVVICVVAVIVVVVGNVLGFVVVVAEGVVVVVVMGDVSMSVNVVMVVVLFVVVFVIEGVVVEGNDVVVIVAVVVVDCNVVGIEVVTFVVECVVGVVIVVDTFDEVVICLDVDVKLDCEVNVGTVLTDVFVDCVIDRNTGAVVSSIVVVGYPVSVSVACDDIILMDTVACSNVLLAVDDCVVIQWVVLDLFPGVGLTCDVGGVVETTVDVIKVWFNSTKHIDNNVR